MNIRKLKGLEITKHREIKEKESGIWVIPSMISNFPYIVKLTKKGPVCNCIDFELRQKYCKHIWALGYYDYQKNIEDFKNKSKPRWLSGTLTIWAWCLQSENGKT